MPCYKMNGKRDGKQKYRVRINYLDSAGKPHQIDRVTYGLEEAKLLELQLAKEVKDEAPAKRMTLQQLFDEYSKARKGSVRESTLDKSQRILKGHVLPDLGGVRLHKLTTPVLMQWKMGMEQKGLAIVTRQNAYAEFHILLNYACRMEYLPKNPLDKVGNFRASGEIKKEMQYYTADAVSYTHLDVYKRQAQQGIHKRIPCFFASNPQQIAPAIEQARCHQIHRPPPPCPRACEVPSASPYSGALPPCRGSGSVPHPGSPPAHPELSGLSWPRSGEQAAP